MASVTCDLVHLFRWEVLEHPPYSPDNALNNFHRFGPLKKHLRRRHFRTDDEGQQAALIWTIEAASISTALTLISSISVSTGWCTDGANALTTIVTMWRSNMYQFFTVLFISLNSRIKFFSQRACYLAF